MPADSLPRRHLAEIEKHFAGTVDQTILWQGEPGSARTLPVVRHLAALQDEMARDRSSSRTASIADLVKRCTGPSTPPTGALPAARQSGALAQLMFLGESPAFERFTGPGAARSLLLAYLSTDDSARVGPLVRRVEAWLRGIRAAGGRGAGRGRGRADHPGRERAHDAREL